MKKMLLFISLIVVVSCSKESADLEFEQQSAVKYDITSLKINPESSAITSDEAINVVKLADMMGKASTKSALKQIEDVVTLSDENGAPLIYAVNYTDNQGYKLVSAIKDYYPILAMVDRGTFNDEVHKTGASVLLDEYINSIGNADKLPSEVRQGFRKLWQQFEKRDKEIPVSTKLNEFDTFIVNTLQSWNNDENVHDFYTLQEAESRLPASLYSTFCSYAQGVGHPDYDYMTYSYVVESIDRQEVDEDDYLLETQWHQEYPYNTSMEYLGLGQYQYPGCNAIALAQIMKYHQWPNTYPWSNMPNSMITLGEQTTLPDFIKDIAEEIKLDNYPINYSTPDKCLTALVNEYGYYGTKSSHNRQSVITSINRNRPVYMCGFPTTGDGHTWVCDGFEVDRRQMIYKLYVIATSHILEYVLACDPYQGEILSEGYFFHMNWGQRLSSNGWYLEGPLAVDDIYYNNNRIDITDIRNSTELN